MEKAKHPSIQSKIFTCMRIIKSMEIYSANWKTTILFIDRCDNTIYTFSRKFLHDNQIFLQIKSIDLMRLPAFHNQFSTTTTTTSNQVK